MRDDGVKDKDGRWKECDDKGSGDEADGIENVHHLKGHQACHKRKNEDSVPEPSEGLIIRLFGPFSLPEENSIEKVDGLAHGAEPSAEKIAENNDGEEHSDGRKHPQDDLFLRQDRNDPDKRIKPKVEVYRDFQFERKSRPNDEIEKEEKRKGLNRPLQIGNRFFHAAVTFFIRTFERLIWPRPNS